MKFINKWYFAYLSKNDSTITIPIECSGTSIKLVKEMLESEYVGWNISIKRVTQLKYHKLMVERCGEDYDSFEAQQKFEEEAKKENNFWKRGDK